MTEEKLKEQIDKELKFFEVKNIFDGDRINFVDDEFGQTGKADSLGKWDKVNINGLIFSRPKK